MPGARCNRMCSLLLRMLVAVLVGGVSGFVAVRLDMLVQGAA